MIHEELENEEAIATALVEYYFQSTNHDSVLHCSGSVMNHRVINSNRVEGHERLYRDYFINSFTYLPQLFCIRFHMC